MTTKPERISVQTRGIGHFVEITGEVGEAVARSGVREGVALVRSRHTTAAITCNEPDPRLHVDMKDAVYATFGWFGEYVIRTVGNLAVESSEHLYFDKDQMAFRGKWTVDGDHRDVGALNNIVQNV